MASPAFAAFVRDAERLTHDPHAIADRLRELLAVDGWLEPRHQLPGRDTYRQHLLHVSPSRRPSVVALVLAAIAGASRRGVTTYVGGFSDAAAWSREWNSASRSSMPASSKMRRAGPGGQMITRSRSSRPRTARACTS